MTRSFLAACALAFPAALFSFQQPAAPPDAIYVNGNVYTAVGDGGSVQRVSALAVANGRIVSTGTTEEIRKLAGKSTKVVDLGGHFVMPGFNDAHVHLQSAGFEQLDVNLVGVKSLAEMQARIAVRAKTAAKGEWLKGSGWDHTLWGMKDAALPTRQDIDQVTGSHPAIFTRVDGHIAVANSAALKLAGITRESRDPQGGKIDRGEVGEPTGIVRETANALVYGKIPPPSPERLRRAIELALRDAAKWGITSAQDNSGWGEGASREVVAFDIFENLERESKLTLRVSEWLPFDFDVTELQTKRKRHPQSDLMLRTGMLKGFMDGSLGSRTAAMLEPYSDDPKNSGIPRYTQEQLNEMTKARLTAGFQIGFHAIGDRGAGMALDAYEFAGAGKSDPQLGSRLRIEHAQVIAPSQFARFEKLGVIASMQPNHLLTDMNWAESRIGAERAKTSYPWAEFLRNGVRLAFGTDYPVEPITPFRGLYAAVTRKNEAGTASYYPDQKLTIDQAIAAYTTGSAYAEFTENDKGTLAPGMFADFVVLDRDITKVAPKEILKTKVLRTVVGGKTVYEASGR